MSLGEMPDSEKITAHLYKQARSQNSSVQSHRSKH